jgi:iron(III) transport system substrate-binding protein
MLKILSRTRRLLTVALAATLMTSGAMAQKTQLLVYSALEADQVKSYKEAFEKTNPNVEINWVRDSTGVITAKLLYTPWATSSLSSIFNCWLF